MTTTTITQTRPAWERRPGAGAKSTWPVPVALVALSLIPVISGLLRLIEVAGGPSATRASRALARAALAGSR